MPDGNDPEARRGPTAFLVVLQLSAGLALLGAAALAGALFVRRPGENRLDAWAYALIPARLTWRAYRDVAELGSTVVFFASVAMLAVLAVFRDRARAVACILGPAAAVVVTEWVAKPLVRRPAVLGGSSYPSGTVTAVAAVATALVLVSPRLLRPLSALAGSAGVLAVSVAVIGLRWHYATDTVGGAFVGTGAVLMVDAAFHVPRLLGAGARKRRVRAGTRGDGRSGRAAHCQELRPRPLGVARPPEALEERYHHR